MKLVAMMKNCLVAGAVLGLLVPQVAMAEGHAVRQAPIHDAALGAGGMLKGGLVSSNGTPEAGRDIYLVSDGELIAKARTDAEGRFEIRGVRAGLYTLQANGVAASYRVWSEAASPPSAVSDILLVSNEDLVARGFIHPNWGKPLLLGSLLIAAGVIGGVIGYNVKDDAS